MKKFKILRAGAILAVSIMCAGQGTAQEIERGNPFIAPPSWAEEQARMDERTRIIFRQLEPELKNDIMKRVNDAQAALEIKLRKRIDLVVENIGATKKEAPGAAAEGGAQTAAEEKKAPSVPEGSTFISCVNKKALYRDKNNTLFQVPADDPESLNRCAR